MAGYFFSAITGFLSGVALYSFFSFGISLPLALMALSGIVLLYRRYVAEDRIDSKIALTALFIFASALGMLRFEIATLRSSAGMLDTFVGQKVSLEGIVDLNPDVREAEQRIVVCADRVEGTQLRKCVRVLVSADLYPRVFYGERLEVIGKLAAPAAFETNAGLVFDYPSYLAKDDMYYTLPFAQFKQVGKGEGNSLVALLLSFKQKALLKVGALLREPESSLLAGALLGVRSGLGPELYAAFVAAGLVHIIVLSGYNVTLVAEFVTRLFGFLPRRVRVVPAGIAIILFALMVGASATVVRAVAMALLVLLARSLGRDYHMSRALLFAGFLMVLANPMVLIFDVSFHLSFLATCALIYLAPLFERKFVRIPERFGIRGIVATTAATQLFVLPYILGKIGTISLAGFLSNVFALPLMPVVMLGGIAAIMVSFLSAGVGFIFSIPVSLALSTVILIAKSAASLPFATITFSLPLTVSLMLYIPLVFWIQKAARRPLEVTELS